MAMPPNPLNRLWVQPDGVAQVSNLPYRRLPVGRRCPFGRICGLEIRDTAGWKPALRGLASGGFTLIEVVLAIGIAAGILMVVLFFYRQSEALRTALLEETSRIGAARLIMERLSLELSAARRCESFQQGLSGGADNLRFVRLDFPLSSCWTNTNQTSLVSAPVPTPFRLVSYSLVQSTNGSSGSGVVRSEEMLSKRTTPVLFTNADDGSLGGGASAATNGLAIGQIQFLRFRYYDGTNWLEAWSAPGLPAGIDVSLGVEPLPPELTVDEYPFETYRRIIYLPSHAAAGTLAQAAAGAKEGP
jgi:type II secretory pathway pseudopilin PulG